MKFCSAAVAAIAMSLTSGAMAAPAKDPQAIERVAAGEQHRHNGRDMQWMQSMMDDMTDEVRNDDESWQQAAREADDRAQLERRQTDKDAQKVKNILTRFLLDGLRTVDSVTGGKNFLAGAVDKAGLQGSLNGARTTASGLGLSQLSDDTHLTSANSAGGGAFDTFFSGQEGQLH